MNSRTCFGRHFRVTAMSENLIEIDYRITLALNGLHSSFWDQFWALLSDTKLWFPAYLIVAVFLFRRLGWKRALIVIACVALSIVASDGV